MISDRFKIMDPRTINREFPEYGCWEKGFLFVLDTQLHQMFIFSEVFDFDGDDDQLWGFYADGMREDPETGCKEKFFTLFSLRHAYTGSSYPEIKRLVQTALMDVDALEDGDWYD